MKRISFSFPAPLSLRVVLAVFVSVKVQHLPKEDKVKLSVDSYTYSWAFLG